MEDEALTAADKATAMKGVFAAAQAATLAEWGMDVVWQEVDEYFGRSELPQIDPEESASRRLRAANFSACPICRRPILSAGECDGRQRYRRAWLEREAVRLRAVGGAS